ncbi:MAG: ABC transporter permease subunit [Thermomicrobiales bacterium]|nr:ABC transporter permease subunit [Thermomicrobiales bacterium]
MRSRHIVWWQMRRSRVGIAALLIGLALFEAIQPVAIKSFGDLDRLQPFLEYLPDSMWAMMNVTPDFLGAFGLAGYLSLGYTHPVYLILTSAAVVWFGSRALAGEMERGSIQFTMSRPLSRTALFAAVLVATIAVTLIVAAIGPVGMLVGLELARPAGVFDRSHLLMAGATTWSLIWAITGITLFCSALSNSMSRSIGLAIGVLVVSYVIDYFAALWEFLEPLEPLSIFDYYEPSSALAYGTIPNDHLIVLGLVGLIGTVAGWAVFIRRDLPA